MDRLIKAHFEAHAELARSMNDLLGSEIAKVAAKLISCLQQGGTIFLCGNGGSAADAQHLAAELTGRYMRPNRRALPAVALTTDTSALTAIGNDFGFDQIFARQVAALGKKGDVLVGISTSGNSRNVVEAFLEAKRGSMSTVLLSGGSGGSLKSLADLSLVIPHSKTPHIQEMHITIGHILCELVDQHFDTKP